MKDLGYSVERCRSGLSAANALIVGDTRKERSVWLAQEEYWNAQLAFAEAREVVVPNGLAEV